MVLENSKRAKLKPFNSISCRSAEYFSNSEIISDASPPQVPLLQALAGAPGAL